MKIVISLCAAALLLCISACASTSGGTKEQGGDKIVENFDGSRLGFQLKSFESSDGTAISAPVIDAKLDPGTGIDGSGSLKLSMSAKTPADGWNKNWDDSYLFFHAYMQVKIKTGESQGVVFSLNPQGFNTIEVGILQEKMDGEHQYTTNMVLPESAWSTVRLPWELLEGSGPQDRPDPGLPSTIIVQVPWQENWKKGYFRSNGGFQATMYVDNVGSWRGPIPVGRYDFEAQLNNSSWDAEVYGLPIMTEYKDSGDPDVYETPGVKNFKLTIEPKTDSSIGAYLSVHLTADLDAGFKPMVDKGLSMGLAIHGRLSQPFGKAAGISFQSKASETLHGGFQFTDIQDDWKSFGANLSLNNFWSKADFAFNELKSDGKAPGRAALDRERPRIDINFDLPDTLLKKAFAQGKLDVSVDIDDIIVE